MPLASRAHDARAESEHRTCDPRSGRMERAHAARAECEHRTCDPRSARMERAHDARAESEHRTCDPRSGRMERGQTLPFWAIGTMASLALLFFLANYVNAVSWQMRAQNAADSAASAMLSIQANVFN